MNTYCKALDIKFNPLKDMDYMKNFPKDRYVKYSLDQSMASDEILMLFDKNEFPYFDLEVFCCPANYKMPVHCDDAYFGNYAKINFVYSEDPAHTMDWYKPNEQWVESERIIHTQYGNVKDNDNPPHYWFKDNEVTHVYSETIKVAQINAGLPHGITTGNSNRICISFIPFHANGENFTMDYVLQTP